MVILHMERKIFLDTALTFDDVLIRPSLSNVEPSDAILKSAVCRGLFLYTPFLSAAMDRVTEAQMAIILAQLGGLGVLHRNCTTAQQVKMVKQVKEKDLLVGAACGPFDIDRALALEKAGCDVVFIDCAHGHNINVIKSAKKIRTKLKKSKLTVGNIATKEAALKLVPFVDGIRVGVGPGSICTTRIVSGVGVPQFSAVREVAKVAQKHGIPVIADGGVRTSGDVAKALAAGASTVMFGNLFAGTKEAPGKIVIKNKKKFKEYRGMGSRSVLASGFSKDRYLQKGAGVPEGVEALVEYKGSVKPIVEDLRAGVQIAMGYVGAKDIKCLHKNAQFVFVTKASVMESHPHDLDIITGH
ncbi:IMP dehydrogenase [Patescibacteria group bacterium]